MIASGSRIEPAGPGRSRRISALTPLALFGVILVIWQIAVTVYRVPPAILPAPTRVLNTLLTQWRLFVDNAATTALEVFLGVILGFVVGVAAALAITYSAPVRRALYPLVIVSQTLPVIALAPVLVIILGFGISSKVVIVAIGVFFPVTVNTVAGLSSTDPDLIKMLRSFSASRLQVFRQVELPSALPYLMTGTQLGLTYGVTGAVVAEWPGAAKGLGILMVTSNALSRTDIVLGAIVVVTVMAMVMFLIPPIVRRRLMPWEEVRGR